MGRHLTGWHTGSTIGAFEVSVSNHVSIFVFSRIPVRINLNAHPLWIIPVLRLLKNRETSGVWISFDNGIELPRLNGELGILIQPSYQFFVRSKFRRTRERLHAGRHGLIPIVLLLDEILFVLMKITNFSLLNILSRLLLSKSAIL